MTRDDIIRMAEECGIPEFENNESQADSILRFAALVTAAEREACARVCEDDKTQAMEWMGASRPGGYFAAAIRARSES